MRSDIIFTTICISDPVLDDTRGHFRKEYYYFETANILVNSVLKNTNHSIVVVTDVPDKFPKSDRVIIHDITKLTDEPRLIDRYMNFHLKRYAMKMAFKTDYKYVVYLDCDVFVENLTDELFNYLDAVDVDVCGKLGVTPIHAMTNVMVTEQKITQFGPHWNDEFFNATLPFEMFFIFKQNKHKQSKFMELWDNVARESLKYDILTLYDSYYIGIGIYYAQMKEINLQQSDDLTLLSLTRQFYDGLRIIHHANICTIDIIPVEPFDYGTLLKRVTYAV